MVLGIRRFKAIGIIVALILIIMFCFLGYRLSYKKDLERINTSAKQ